MFSARQAHSASSSAAQKLKLFISYSRSDNVFADELVAGLEFARQFEITIDRQSIIEGEDWKKRLGALIADADTVVFLLSPESAASEMCGWEVDEASRLSKRIVPVLIRHLGPTSAPTKLAALNYVRFDDGRSFMAGLNALVRALNTDVDWLREHTRIFIRAQEWHAAGRKANRMLSGSDIEAAKLWLARRPNHAPEVTDLHLSFIQASEQAETERANAERKRLEEIAAAQEASAKALADREAAVQTLSRRTTFGLFAAGGLTATAGGLAWWGSDAERRFQEARRNAAEAEWKAIDRAIDREAMREDIAGQLVVFAAGPDQFALDGPDDGTSPFTQAMISELEDERATLQAAFARATRKVLEFAAKTDHVQRPYLASDLNADVYLFRKPKSRKLKALIISADRWQGTVHGKLALIPSYNSTRDAKAWEAVLRKADFETRVLSNPLKGNVEAAVAEMVGGITKSEIQPEVAPAASRTARAESVRPLDNSIAFVFYSGVGFSHDFKNYLGLTGSGFGRADDLLTNAVNLTELQSLLRKSHAASILVMDTNFTSVAALAEVSNR